MLVVSVFFLAFKVTQLRGGVGAHTSAQLVLSTFHSTDPNETSLAQEIAVPWKRHAPCITPAVRAESVTRRETGSDQVWLQTIHREQKY